MVDTTLSSGGRATTHGDALQDDFDDERTDGTVVGSISASGARRQGVDVEGIIGIDNGALRLRPLNRPGWGREGVVYGPFMRQPGLALAVLALNGHNASQTYYMPETPRERVGRWVRDLRRGRLRRPVHHENFAVGWFRGQSPRRPLRAGNAFVMHSATEANGELWAAAHHGPARVLRGVQNVPILYVVVLRERGAAYYAASLPGAYGLGAYPRMRPLAIDTRDTTRELHAGVQQRILGEVGYRVDTRVYGVRVAEVPELSAWFGTAHVADSLTGAGPLDGSVCETGGTWVGDASLVRTTKGVRLTGGEAEAVVAAPEPAGLVHAVVATGSGRGAAGLVFRSDGAERGWTFLAGPGGCELAVREEGMWTVVANDASLRTGHDTEHALQVLDDGSVFGLYLDGALVFGGWFDDVRHRDLTGTGVRVTGRFSGLLARFEAHPREVEAPQVLDMTPPTVRAGTVEVLNEDFSGPAGDLHGTPCGGGAPWERSEGVGVIERTGAGYGRVAADREHPNPGRTIYTAPWDFSDYAEVTVEITQPGARRHEGEAGRGGVVLWQDADNYLVVNLFVDDTFNGASISTFYHLRGQEVMWDAVWTLVPGVTWGSRNTMTVRFDGRRFLALLDGRPSLYRELTDVYPDAAPLEIRRVGLIANWEWGDDTGSLFHRFAGRA